jgi:6-pyruvoyltetrahydropterin/6-carboxytetrahydropterin synthase
MSEPLLRLAAQAGFEAARQQAGPAPWQQRLHGHSFSVQVRAAAPGAGLNALQAATQAVMAPWQHRLLNDVCSDTSNAGLASGVAHALAATGVGTIEQVSVHAGPEHGAVWNSQAPGAATHFRRYAFEAAHRLPRVPPGHQCGRMHGHGFGVLVQAGVQHSLQALDEAWAPLHFVLHQRCLNQLPGLANPTSEMLAAWLWPRLREALPGLVRVTVFETGSSGAAFDGRRHAIWKQMTLDSAVHDDAGLHGHTYTLRLHLGAPLDEVLGWVVDFGDVKRLFAPVFAQLDHHPLHELPGLHGAGCADIAAWVWRQARERLPALNRIDLHQTPGCGVVLAADAAALEQGP